MTAIGLNRESFFRIMPCVLAALLCLAGVKPAEALPDASTPTLAGGVLGGEIAVAGKNVSGGSLPYYVYAGAGLARAVSARAELLGGGGRQSMTVVSAAFAALPTPFVTVNFEPGVTWAAGSAGPSLGLRATGSFPLLKWGVTGYGRIHAINSRITTEIGLGADYPVAPHLRAAISAIRFNGGFEPNGLMLLIGIKAKLGV